MRWLGLYLRSRRVPLALTLMVAATAMVWALWLTYSESTTVDIRLVSLTVMMAVAAFVPTLAGADDALDHTGSINWPVRRAAHVLVLATMILALLWSTTVTDARFEPFALVLRNTVGLVGLAALGAALVGAARAWIAPLVWALVCALPMMGEDPRPAMQVAGWLVQPTGTTAATVCAAVLATAGPLAYIVRGGPRRPATETAPDR